MQLVLAGAADEAVVLLTTGQHVVAAQTDQHLASGSPGQGVLPAGAVDDLVVLREVTTVAEVHVRRLRGIPGPRGPSSPFVGSVGSDPSVASGYSGDSARSGVRGESEEAAVSAVGARPVDSSSASSTGKPWWTVQVCNGAAEAPSRAADAGCETITGISSTTTRAPNSVAPIPCEVPVALIAEVHLA